MIEQYTIRDYYGTVYRTGTYYTETKWFDGFSSIPGIPMCSRVSLKQTWYAPFTLSFDSAPEREWQKHVMYLDWKASIKLF